MAEPSASRVTAVCLFEMAHGGGELARRFRHPPLQQLLVLAALDDELAPLERAAGGEEQLVRIHRLLDEVVGADVQDLDGRLHVADAGQYEHRRVGIEGEGLLQEPAARRAPAS